MRCETVVRRLDAFRTRELQERERRSMAEHLATCPPCAEELVGLETLATHAAPLRPHAPEGLLRKVLSAAGDGYGSVDTDLGPVWVGFNERGVTLVHLGTRDARLFEKTYEERLGRRPAATAVPERLAEAIRRAAAGADPGRVRLDLSGLPLFEREVLEMLRRIPRGEVRPYAWVAREMGRPKAVRAVGNAVARNPLPLLVPCHRVVPTQGGIGKYGYGSALKRALLEREGVPVEELERLSGGRVRYLGCTTTRVFCLPTCRDIRRSRPERRVRFTAEREAVAAGYRPCRHCRPAAASAATAA